MKIKRKVRQSLTLVCWKTDWLWIQQARLPLDFCPVYRHIAMRHCHWTVWTCIRKNPQKSRQELKVEAEEKEKKESMKKLVPLVPVEQIFHIFLSVLTINFPGGESKVWSKVVHFLTLGSLNILTEKKIGAIKDRLLIFPVIIEYWWRVCNLTF